MKLLHAVDFEYANRKFRNEDLKENYIENNLSEDEVVHRLLQNKSLYESSNLDNINDEGL